MHNSAIKYKYRQGVEFNMPEDPHGNRQYATYKKTHTKSNITCMSTGLDRISSWNFSSLWLSIV